MKNNNFFWIGYSDLMTSLFFIMLVLFVVTVGYLKHVQGTLIIENERLKRLLKLEEQFKPLEEDGDFYYLPNCKKYIVKELMGIEIFKPNEIAIKEEYLNKTIQVGKKIEAFLGKLHNNNPDLTYLLVIEGNMANTWDQSINTDDNWGYVTSYSRALSVYKHWLRNGIDLRKYNVEVLLCGSGFNGLCRDNIEEYNKRFSIQIIPKIENRK